MRIIERNSFVLGLCLLLGNSEAMATTYFWDEYSTDTEFWNIPTNWSPTGIPGSNDHAIFEAGFLAPLAQQISMPSSSDIFDLSLRDGRFEFDSVTPWTLQVGNVISGLGVLRISPDSNVFPSDGKEVDLTLRDGEVHAQTIRIGDGDESASTVTMFDMLVTSDSLDVGAGDLAYVLLTLIDSELNVDGDVFIGDYGQFEVSEESVVNLGGSSDNFTVFGELLVNGEVNAHDFQLEGFLAQATVAAGGILRADNVEISDNADLTIQGTGSNQALFEAESLTLQDGIVIVGNLGVMDVANLLVSDSFELKSGGRLEVPANNFSPGGGFVWSGGTIAFDDDFRVDTVGADNPFEGNLAVLAGRTLDVNGQLGVGTSRQGSLGIASGLVTSASGKVGGALTPTGPATVTVSGATGQWNVEGNLTAGGLVGLQPTSIAISGGADMSVVEAFIGAPGLRADVTIDGAGSTLVSSDSVFLGGNATTAGGQGTLALTNSGVIGVGNSSNDQLKVWEGYAVTMNQAAINARNLVVRGSIAPAAGALISGSITAANSVVIDGGSVTLTTFGPASLVASSNVDILAGGSLLGYIQGNSGTEVLVTGSGSTWTTHNVVANVLGTTTAGVGRIGELEIGPGGTVNFGAGVSYAAGAVDGLVLFDGTLNAPTFNGGTVGITGRGTVNATYTGSGPIQATGPLTIGNATTVNGFATTGQIVVGTNTLTLNDLDVAQLGSSTQLGAPGVPGTLIAANGLAVGSGETVSGFGTISTPNNAAKRLTNDGSMSGTVVSQRLTLTGDVTGIGSFSNVEFTGTLSPGITASGASTALISGGNYKFTNTSNLVMEIQGANPGFGYDVIFSTGQFIADGIFTVNLLNGYSPTLGQTFDMLDFTTLTGTFDVLSLPALTPGLIWNTSQLYSQGLLSVVAGFLEADFEEDGDVDGADLTRWRNNYGTGTTHVLGDADADGDADGADFLVWQRQVGSAPAVVAGAVVPEPAGWALLMLAAAMVLSVNGRCRR